MVDASAKDAAADPYVGASLFDLVNVGCGREEGVWGGYDEKTRTSSRAARMKKRKERKKERKMMTMMMVPQS